ncbi:unnamed protein product [Prunus armeniaca]
MVEAFCPMEVEHNDSFSTSCWTGLVCNVGVHPFCVYSYDGRAKFPTALRTIDWSTSQLSLVCERATASNEQSSRLSLEWITCAPSY